MWNLYIFKFNAHRYGLELLLLLLIAGACTGVTCAVTGEICNDGICKCGTASSCQDQATSAICDAANSVCKCSSTVGKCATGQICLRGRCSKYILGAIFMKIYQESNRKK